VATVFLMVGLHAAGKTTRAVALAARHRALLLSPDEWMIPLFGEPEADGRRDVLEGRLLTLGLRAVRLGVNVVLDFGCWARDERVAIRWLAHSAGASCQIVYVAVDRATQLQRLALRPVSAAGRTFEVSEAEADRARAFFQVPDAAELADGDLPAQPAGWLNWPAWAADRWPSLDTTETTEVTDGTVRR
jgi:predicted kinase